MADLRPGRFRREGRPSAGSIPADVRWTTSRGWNRGVPGGARDRGRGRRAGHACGSCSGEARRRPAFAPTGSRPTAAAADPARTPDGSRRRPGVPARARPPNEAGRRLPHLSQATRLAPKKRRQRPRSAGAGGFSTVRESAVATSFGQPNLPPSGAGGPGQPSSPSAAAPSAAAPSVADRRERSVRCASASLTSGCGAAPSGAACLPTVRSDRGNGTGVHGGMEARTQGIRHPPTPPRPTGGDAVRRVSSLRHSCAGLWRPC